MIQRILELQLAFKSIMTSMVLSHNISVSLSFEYSTTLLLVYINIYFSVSNIWCNKFLAVGGVNVETGSIVQAVVLDVSKMERLVDLSLKPEFVDRSKQGSSKVESHKKVIIYGK